jgi:diguanylate cyclase (GGDEF)-like protein
VVLFDASLRLVVAEGEGLLGYDARRLRTGEPIEDAVGAELWASLRGPALAALAGHTQTRDLGEGDGPWYRVTTRPVQRDDGSVTGGLIVAQDLTDTREALERLAYRANHDDLTGLPNRAAFRERVTDALHRSRRGLGDVALLFVDLDRFKTFNDTLGHEAGDELLRVTARRLARSMREADMVARLSGDEFAVLLEGATRERDATTAAARILRAVARPLRLHEEEVVPTASIGIAMARPGGDASELLSDADAAMYRAKARGGNRCEHFDPDTNRLAVRRLGLERALHAALEREELRVQYQPQVEIATGAVVGVEALVRWLHPEQGLLRPDSFLPQAEQAGLIGHIGDWVLETACRQMVEWADEGFGHLRLAVNLCAPHVWQPDFAATVQRVLRDTGIPPERLELELTERFFERDLELATSLLAHQRETGVRVSIDDFGTGYSALARLRDFPADALKIDRSIVAELGSGPRIVRSIVELTHAFELEAVAEGVESPSQLAALRRSGCDLAQGYHISPPLPPELALPWLRSRAAAAARPAA